MNWFEILKIDEDDLLKANCGAATKYITRSLNAMRDKNGERKVLGAFKSTMPIHRQEVWNMKRKNQPKECNYVLKLKHLPTGTKATVYFNWTERMKKNMSHSSEKRGSFLDAFLWKAVRDAFSRHKEQSPFGIVEGNKTSTYLGGRNEGEGTLFNVSPVRSRRRRKGF